MKKEKIIINNEISLVKYYPNYSTSLKWYLDKDVCKQVDNRDTVYNLELLKRMYKYLNKNGDLFYIKYKNKLVGDVCLENNNYVAIVVSKEYQNKHIGRLVINAIIKLAKKKNIKEIKACIYVFNKQSQRMFLSVGFKQIDKEEYIYSINQ